MKKVFKNKLNHKKARATGVMSSSVIQRTKMISKLFFEGKS